ncbi:MAG: type II secretion system F family protein [Natronomonas sp.]
MSETPPEDAGPDADQVASEDTTASGGGGDLPKELIDGASNVRPDGIDPEEAILGSKATPGTPSGSTRGELRAAYGYVRTYFKTRPDRYRTLQRQIDQARISDTYDEYLTAVLRRSLGRGVLTAVLFAVLTAVAVVGASFLTNVPAAAGFVPRIDALAAALAVEPITTTIGADVAAVALVAAVAVAVPTGAVIAVATWIEWRYLRLRRQITARRRNIALTLPYAITFLYALSRGGADILVSIRALADERQMYGESAAEFDTVVREMDLFGNDLLTALRNTRELTPSEPLEQFLTDLIGVIDTGGNVESFLDSEVDDYVQTAIDEQKQYLERLAALSEAFVVVFVAAPLFLIVVLVVISFLGGDVLPVLVGLIYVGIPAGLIGFVLLLDVLSRPFKQPTIPVQKPISEPEATGIEDDPRYKAHHRRRRLRAVGDWIRYLRRLLRRRPGLAFWISQPLAIGAVVAAVAFGFADPSPAAFVAEPVTTTVGLIVAPLLIATVPVAVLYERKARHEREIVQRFPDVLGLLANANQMGVTLADAFGVVADSMSGRIATELQTVRNDLRWNHDIADALDRFGARLSVPQLSRTLSLITVGSRVSGDIHQVLDIAAENTRIRARLERIRRQEMTTYVVIVVMGFLIYLFVIVVLSTSFIEPLAEVTDFEIPEGRQSPITPTAIPVDAYRTLFFHSALIQGFGSGILAGKLAEDDLLAGLKYGLGLVVVTVGVFVVVL